MGIPLSWDTFRHHLLYVAQRKPETLPTCRRVFEGMKRYFSDKELTQESVYGFFDYLRAKGDRNSTLNNYIKFLRHIGKLLEITWLGELKYFKEEEQIFDTLSPNEIRAILTCHPKRYPKYEYMNERWDVVIETLLATGMRRQELCNLTWDNFRGDRFILKRTKTSIDRVCKLSKCLSEKIKEIDRFNEYVFGSRKGMLIAHEINNELQTRARLLNICKRITAHTLRRTAATEAASKGINLAYIQRFLGHKSIQTTSKYIQVDEAALDAVSRALTVNEGGLDMDSVYERVRCVAQEFIPNFKVELKKTKSGVRLYISK